jgi:putative PIN family toxin of toxin-antitoxin system
VNIVLDTAVLVSAIRSSAGASAEVVRLAALGKVGLLLDFKLVSEYRDVALRREHVHASAKTAEEIEAIIAELESLATPVLVVHKHRPLSTDANDDMVLDIAINGHADAIVTSNLRDFVIPATRFGIPVLTPAEFLTALRKGHYDHAN